MIYDSPSKDRLQEAIRQLADDEENIQKVVILHFDVMLMSVSLLQCNIMQLFCVFEFENSLILFGFWSFFVRFLVQVYLPYIALLKDYLKFRILLF